MELTTIDIQNILVFLGRATLKGREAVTFVELTAKLNALSKELEENESNGKD